MVIGRFPILIIEKNLVLELLKEGWILVDPCIIAVVSELNSLIPIQPRSIAADEQFNSIVRVFNSDASRRLLRRENRNGNRRRGFRSVKNEIMLVFSAESPIRL